MITIAMDMDAVKSFVLQSQKKVDRATERTIDRTARMVRDTIRALIPKVFQSPVPWTVRSLQLTLTQNHNMEASVWFKEPERRGRAMREHYLIPQVDGTAGQYKGFEKALGLLMGKSGGVRMVSAGTQAKDGYGNMPTGKIKQMLSMLGIADYAAGSNSNMTKRSRLRNKKEREYVVVLPGNQQGLKPGVYERFSTGRSISKYERKRAGFGAFQRGKGKAPMTGVIRARGLRPVYFTARDQSGKTTPRLPFYKTSQDVAAKEMPPIFSEELAKQFNG